MGVLGQRYEQDCDLAQLRDHPRNPRRGDDGAVAGSIDANGFYGAIIAQTSTRQILAGHTRRRALAAAGSDRGPVLWVDCDDDTATRILIADNRTAELAAWDDSELLELLGEIKPEDLIGTGFDEAAVEELLRAVETAGMTPLDVAAEWDAAGMPGYLSEDKAGAYQTSVHFRSEQDADRFFALLDRPRAKRWWYPEPDGFVGFLSDVTITGTE